MSDLDVRRVYKTLLDCWNRRRAAAFAALFEKDGVAIGFDGSTMNGRSEIEAQLKGIFANHPTASYVADVRLVRQITADVAILQAVAGMVPPGKSEINPAVNAVQSLVLTRHQDQWLIALLQNTPAAFHGRPEASAELTRELQALVTKTA